jgi:hypothetical protein
MWDDEESPIKILTTRFFVTTLLRMTVSMLIVEWTLSNEPIVQAPPFLVFCNKLIWFGLQFF